MKILILVLSYSKPPFDLLMKTQQETWDSIDVEGVSVVYYHGSLLAGDNVRSKITQHPENGAWSREAQFKCTDAYYYMAAKFKICLDYVKDWNYDIIFRTNSSSYVNKQRLVEFAKNLPTKGLYAGWEIEGNAGYNIVSGAGFFLSRDTADILRENIDPKFEREEDVYCGQILHEHGIKIIDDKSRFDINIWLGNNPPVNRYHYRFKGVHGDRNIDAVNMQRLHKFITDGY